MQIHFNAVKHAAAEQLIIYLAHKLTLAVVNVSLVIRSTSLSAEQDLFMFVSYVNFSREADVLLLLWLLCCVAAAWLSMTCADITALCKI